ncbi:hypothetical protein THOM_3125, partial [Trachipleistophora hominis]
VVLKSEPLMKLHTKDNGLFELDALPDDMALLKDFITEYQLTTSSQQKLALLYYENNEFENCLELLKFCVSQNLFSSNDLQKLNLTLLAFYIEQGRGGKYLDECTKLFLQLENTKYKDELNFIKGYFFLYKEKYDTALFLLSNDVLGRNLIHLSMKCPEKVESSDPLLQGYKAYLENDEETAVKYFKQEYQKNKKVLPYLLRLAPNEFSYKDSDEWTKETPEYRLSAKEQDNVYTEQELLDTFGDVIKDEFLYQRARQLHLKEQYEEALECYIQCCGRRAADYQVRRILGLPFEDNKELGDLYQLKKKNKEIGNPVEGFINLKNNRKYLDDATYYCNRGYYVYFIDYYTEQIKKEIKDDLEIEDFSEAALCYFRKALEKADLEQEKGIAYNIQMLEKEKEYEYVERDLEDAIENVKNDPDRSLATFIKYVERENNVVAARGIGVVLAMRNDPFCIKIFKYLHDDHNLKIFLENQINKENNKN